MYDIISNLIAHDWQSNYSGEQQYVYAICGVLICVLAAVIFDNIFRLFRMLVRKL